ncbi:aminotransferase class I/II-fold pyridoxal phosphate-dependent enzyme [Streptomyces sp. NPDC048253]|uniref:aminotransferase class I/II-fold pyridoxal phosphate-dependent enzyme n=1 Tax=Streptomyces sp. NPDC048253 TaxID=3365524 RepID=UPI00371B807A
MEFGPAHSSTLDLVDRWQREGTYPLFPLITQAATTRARIGVPHARPGSVDTHGRPVTVFGSADYLGLARHPEVVEGALAATRRFGTGTYGTQAVGGYTRLHQELEAAVATWSGRPAALLFPTGMQANLGVLGTLAGPRDHVFADRFNHQSITMGVRLSGATLHVFRHNDPAHLAELLRTAGPPDRSGRRLIVVDGLFSADGDLAPLAEIADLAERHDALLVVDEAHSAGTLGPQGRGVAELCGVPDRVDVVTGTFSKAFASTGGFVCADADVVTLLRHSADAYLLSLGLPPGTVGAALAALSVLAREGTERRRRLQDNARTLRARLHAAGVGTAGSAAHVVVVPVGTMDRTAHVTRQLAERGLMVCPLFPPAVPIGGARLRLGVCAEHTEEDIDHAAALIAAALAETPLPTGPAGEAPVRGTA